MAFATILAVVAGLVISASGAVAHDVWSNIVREGKDSEKEEVWVAKIAAVSIGAIAIAIAVIGGAGLNISFMVGLAFAVAASANFPALLLALTWRRFNTDTAPVTGVLVWRDQPSSACRWVLRLLAGTVPRPEGRALLRRALGALGDRARLPRAAPADPDGRQRQRTGAAPPPRRRRSRIRSETSRPSRAGGAAAPGEGCPATRRCRVP